jgi:hypothetical protein
MVPVHQQRRQQQQWPYVLSKLPKKNVWGNTVISLCSQMQSHPVLYHRYPAFAMQPAAELARAGSFSGFAASQKSCLCIIG